MPAVADSSVLIWLAKVGRLSLLREQYGHIIIPPEAYREAVEEGLREGYGDAYLVKEAVKAGWIHVDMDESVERDARSLMEELRDVHEGEAAALLLAARRRVPLLIDESSGRALARAFGVASRGVLHVLLKALHDDVLTSSEVRDDLTLMIASGYRIEPRLLERVIREVTRFEGMDRSRTHG